MQVENLQAAVGEHAYEENPTVTPLLGSAGLTAVDMQLFRVLREHDASVFVHGSLMESRLSAGSDIDFVIVGDIERIPSDIKDTLMPRLMAAIAIKDIAYTSTSQTSQYGRKMSLHFSGPAFRTSYAQPGQAVATEYRPARHAKTGARNYFLPGMDEDNNTYLVNFSCASHEVSGYGSITDTPQTGRFTLDGEDIYAEDNHEKPAMTAADIIKITPDGAVSGGPTKKPTEIMALGLEFDKMHSDTPLYSQSLSNGEYEEYVLKPIRRSAQLLSDYTGIKPSVVTKSLFDELARFWPKIKPHKTRRK